MSAACHLLVTYWSTIDAAGHVCSVLVALAGTAVAATTVSASTVAWAGTVADPVGTPGRRLRCGGPAFLYSHDYLQKRGVLKGEYYVLGLFALLGIMVLVSANSLITLYLGVELQALALYAMVAFNRESGVAAEAAIKYFVLGSIASGALLFGMSIIYGVTGALELGAIGRSVALLGAEQIGLLFGLSFLIVGVAFKFGAVPFHMWVPAVYHGAPTPVTLFLGSAPKIASFALAYRLLAEGLGGLHPGWQDMLVVVAVLSMAIGNIVAIAQTNLKRMRRTTISMSVSFCSASSWDERGLPGGAHYMIAYVIMAIAGFGMTSCCRAPVSRPIVSTTSGVSMRAARGSRL